MDLVIIGAGPAGLSAALYANTFGIECIVLDNPEQLPQLSLAPEVTNFPGFESITGMELLSTFKKQVKKLGIKIIEEKVTDIKGMTVVTDSDKYDAKAILIATGAKHRKADIIGESEFLGKGVSYCGMCDGPLFKGKDVIVYGGGDTALKTAVFLQGLGCKVSVVHRRNEFRAAKENIDKAKKAGIKFILERTIKEIAGSKLVEKVILDNDKEVKCQGVFIAIGEVPAVELVKKLGVKINESNFIIVDSEQRTNVKGVYAAGDVTNTPMRQIVTACGDGARAIQSISKFLKGEK